MAAAARNGRQQFRNLLPSSLREPYFGSANADRHVVLNIPAHLKEERLMKLTKISAGAIALGLTIAGLAATAGNPEAAASIASSPSAVAASPSNSKRPSPRSSTLRAGRCSDMSTEASARFWAYRMPPPSASNAPNRSLLGRIPTLP